MTMKEGGCILRKIGCFHAHYSNIEPIEQALGAYEVELAHFVDPGLDRIRKDADFTPAVAEKKVLEMLNWISSCHVDAILITCTFFTAVLQDELHRFPIPVIKIDDPLFHDACTMNAPLIFVFTNPGTVNGTLQRLTDYSVQSGKEIQVAHSVLEHTFELIMQGKKEEYNEAVSKGLSRIAVDNPQAIVAAAQLSMAAAALQAEAATGRRIINPLVSLASHTEQVLLLQRKG
jgi:glutamate racemase